MLIDLHQLYRDRIMETHLELVNYMDIAIVRGICTMYDEARRGDGPVLVSVMGACLVVPCKTAADAEWVARDLAARVDAAEQQQVSERVLMQAQAAGHETREALREKWQDDSTAALK